MLSSMTLQIRAVAFATGHEQSVSVAAQFARKRSFVIDPIIARTAGVVVIRALCHMSPAAIARCTPSPLPGARSPASPMTVHNEGDVETSSREAISIARCAEITHSIS